MAMAAVAFPVLPGKAEDGRRFAQEVMERRQEAAAAWRRQGTTREWWFLQATPAGEMVIVVLESADPQKAFQIWAASTDPYDVWFKERAGSICGIDFNQPIPALPEQLLEWAAD
ncbi:MAG TPA: DUF6176 family protein [Chloroflexota bacterium]|nr:DUF6176 family protein [Chloroflexota bacterium]